MAYRQNPNWEPSLEARQPRLPHDNLGMWTTESHGDDEGNIDYYIYQNFGITPDPDARALIQEIYSSFEGQFTNYDRVFDLILDMPPGYQTSDILNRVLVSMPLGLLARKLRNRCIDRFGTDSAFNQLVYSGLAYRIRNTSEEATEPIPNTYRGSDGQPYYPISIQREVDSFDLHQFPLSRIILSIPSPVSVDENPALAGMDRSFLVNTEEDRPRLTLGSEDFFNPENYVNLITRFPSGSDVSFFFFTDSGSILKRYYPVNDHSRTPNAVIRAKPFRSAGLRQVLLDDHIDEFFCKDANSPVIARFFVPGGSRNCFLSSLRWGYIEFQYDKYLKEYCSLMESAQDDDMLRLSSSVPRFDMEDTSKKIDEIISSILRERAYQDGQKPDLSAYLKKYRNGFPTKELNQIAKLLFTRFNIHVFYWRINGKGKWVNIISSVDNIELSTIQITMIQMSESGTMLDLSIENEKEEESEDNHSTTMGFMTHAIGIFPPFSFLKESSHLNQQNRKLFVEKLNAKLKPYIESIYNVLEYNSHVSFDLISQLVKHQTHRYSLKETKTLIFDIPSPPKIDYSKRPRREISSCSTQVEVDFQAPPREFPKIFVFAYDLETVSNSSAIQNMVYQPFRKVLDSGMSLFYDSQNCQVPFSAQYVPVNVDDEGNFLAQKLEAESQPLKYPTTYYGKYHDVFISPSAFTNYGIMENGLGSCVESFLCEVAKYVHGYGGEQAYLFACNGSKFDSFVILQFQRFEISHILKTSRGILTVSLRVPIVCPGSTEYDYREDENPKITIKLRDVSLIVPGSLARLCKGFNVPAEFVKLDFPIHLVNARNCYHPDIMKVCRPYGENDVLSLAFIIKAINRLIGNSFWKPCDPYSERPPICQFVTCMGMIRKSTKQHFDKILPKSLQPKAVDIPALRTWIINAAIGGRVTAYAKTYASPFVNDILSSAASNNVAELQLLYDLMTSNAACMQCLDFTSLYPFVMDSCPLPMGGIHAIDVETCNRYIDAMHCEECDKLRRLCSSHRYYYNKNDISPRPFAIIIVKNIKIYPLNDYRNLCPRKTYNSSTKKPLGILYSLEHPTEFSQRTFSREEIRDPQSFTNVDLYWMRRQGYSFEIVGGISFSQLMIYNTFIGPAFQMRIEAKKAGNKLLSDFLKLNYNGSYGITIQQDITESYFLARLPSEYKDHDPRSPFVQRELFKVTRSRKNGEGICCSEELTGEGFYLPNGQSCFQKRKKEHLAEYFSEQSPLQIGAAVLAYARHIGNLILFNVDPKHYTYTDTDSIAISQSLIESDPHIMEAIIERDDAPMGSLKNDHGENNGTNPRIFLSLIGAKKVKCHLTLNKEGQVKIFNTFKGLNASTKLNGVALTPEYAEYITTKVLFDLNQKNSTDAVQVQSWKRDLQYGVSIADHLQVFDSNTYMNDHKGLTYFKHASGEVEYLIPHGMDDSFCDTKVTYDFITGEKSYEKPRKQLFDPDAFSKFMKVYYEGCDRPYNPGGEEYSKILDLFKSI